MTKKKLTFSIVLVSVMIVFGLKMAPFFSPKSIDPAAARAKGSPEAKVKIIEFIDFQCPACAMGAKQVAEYMVKHPQDIQVQVKYFPLARTHSHAMQSALYSECAGRQNRFWQFHELLMSQQQQWSGLVNADTAFQNIAREAELDLTQLNACLGSEAAAKAVNDDRALGQSLGVQSTPTYFINNKMVVGSKSLTDELNADFPSDK